MSGKESENQGPVWPVKKRGGNAQKNLGKGGEGGSGKKSREGKSPP